MNNDNGFAGRIAARLPVDEVAIADIQQAMVMGFYFGVELRHAAAQVSLDLD
jgi:hypothetical protein